MAVKAINLKQLLIMLSDGVILRQYFIDSNVNVVLIIFILWHCMGLYGILWHFMALYGILWHFMAFYGILWHFMAFCGILWHFMALRTLFYHSL